MTLKLINSFLDNETLIKNLCRILVHFILTGLPFAISILNESLCQHRLPYRIEFAILLSIVLLAVLFVFLFLKLLSFNLRLYCSAI